MDQADFIEELSKLRTSATFLTLKGYRSSNSEIADFNIVYHISYKNTLLKSIATLNATLNAMSFSNDLERQAKAELLASFEKSLVNIEENPIEERDDGFTRIQNEDGSYVKGVKISNKTGELHIYGLIANKRVILPGNYKVKNSRPLTIAKDKLKSLCAVGKFRQFIIAPDKVDSVQVEKLSLLPPE